jgi:hypothetical protein
MRMRGGHIQSRFCEVLECLRCTMFKGEFYLPRGR